MRKHPKISQENEIKILEYFKKNDDNRSTHIAKVFGVQVHQVESIINEFLKPKIKSLKIY